MMTTKSYRVGIVGASSLAGKELAETLAESSLAASDIILLDDEDLAGQIVAAGDEANFIQKIDADSFAAMDFVFFAGGPDHDQKILEGRPPRRRQHHRHDLRTGSRTRRDRASSLGAHLHLRTHTPDESANSRPRPTPPPRR